MPKYANTSPCCKRSVLILVALLSLLCGHQRLKADIIIVINDGMDGPVSNYDSFFFAPPNPDDTSALQSLSPITNQGNPGHWLVMGHIYDVNRDVGGAPLNGNGSVELIAGLTNNVVSYNPTTSGTILDISFSLDINFLDNGEPVQFNEFIFLVDDGNSGFLISGPSQTISPTIGWQTIAVTGLTNVDLSGIDLTGGDGPLSFGFGFRSSGDVTGGPVFLQMGVDNFSVTVNAVPEPSAGMLVGAMLLLAAHHRRVRTVAGADRQGQALFPVFRRRVFSSSRAFRVQVHDSAERFAARETKFETLSTPVNLNVGTIFFSVAPVQFPPNLLVHPDLQCRRSHRRMKDVGRKMAELSELPSLFFAFHFSSAR